MKERALIEGYILQRTDKALVKGEREGIDRGLHPAVDGQSLGER